MSDTSIYLVRLRPLNPFFFGQERNFGIDVNTNYLVRSRVYPQQTSLLGLVRHQLLIANDLINENGPIEKEVIAAKLIGTTGFQVGGKSKFGIIKRLSPVYLHNGQELFTPAPMDNECELIFADKNEVRSYLGNKTITALPKLEKYNPKEGLNEKWLSINGENLAQQDIFLESAQVGILKKAKGERDEEGFFKQFFVRFASANWHFAFYLELDDTLGFNHLPENQEVTFGKEQSGFMMEVSKEKDKAFPKFTFGNIPKGPHTKAILLSDTFVPNTIYKYCDFAISSTIDFRFLKTSVTETNHYYNFFTGEKQGNQSVKEFEKVKKSFVGRSSKYNMLKRGSVLYLNNLKKFKKEVKKKCPEFRTIGYNQYQIVNSTSH